MRFKIITASLLISLCFFSCKDDKKKDSDVDVKVEKSQTFDVTLNMIVKQDDKFQLFYTDISTPGFDEKKSVWVEVKGSETPQNILFNLPKDEIPTNLRVDIGVNAKQPEMKFNSFKMSYFDKSFELREGSILKAFIVGDALGYNKTTSTINVDQTKSKIYDPFFYPQDNLKTEILKIVK